VILQNPNASRALLCQFRPAADIRRIGSGPLRAQSRREHMQQPTQLFDDLVGAQEERLWDGQPHRLCRLEIDDKIKFDRLLDRDIAGF
jgi:hypothetical protein